MKKNSQDFDWNKWIYENNSPYAIIKMGFSHALMMCISTSILYICFAIYQYSNIKTLFYLISFNLMITILFLFIITIPLIFLHSIHYNIFKNILLLNKQEYVVLIGWFLILLHFIIIYFSIDIIIVNLNNYISSIQLFFVLISYLIGFGFSLIKFKNHFYNKSNVENRFNDLLSKINKENNFIKK